MKSSYMHNQFNMNNNSNSYSAYPDENEVLLIDGLLAKINGINYKSFEFSVDKNLKSNSWLSLIITEGKNREIRNIMEFLGLSVSRLIRVSYGPFLIENLKPGEISEVSFNDLQSIYNRSIAK